MRREESLLILRLWPAATPARRVVREHLLDEQDTAGRAASRLDVAARSGDPVTDGAPPGA